MKILILGGTGMAGHTISLYFKEAGYDVTALSRRKVDYVKNIIGDVTDFKSLSQIIQEGQYDAIINAVGVLNKDAEENKAQAVLLNSYLPHFISQETEDTKTKLIQMSTDCVFSGETGGYIEHSLRDGPTFYDRSKALGEIDNDKDLTFRNSIIGPDMNINGIGLFNWFMSQEGPINGFTEAMWTGVTTLTLAQAMEQALKEDLTGLYHLVNNQKINKYELLQLFNHQMKDDQVKINPTDEFKVDKSMKNTREDFSFVVPSYEDMILEMKQWINNHREIYSHYFE